MIDSNAYCVLKMNPATVFDDLDTNMANICTYVDADNLSSLGGLVPLLLRSGADSEALTCPLPR